MRARDKSPREREKEKARLNCGRQESGLGYGFGGKILKTYLISAADNSEGLTTDTLCL